MTIKPIILFIVLFFFGIQKLPLQQLWKVFDTYTCAVEEENNEAAKELLKKQLQIEDLIFDHFATVCVQINIHKTFSLKSSHSLTSYIIDIESPPPNGC